MMWNSQILAANVSIRRGNARSATRALSKATIVVCAAQVRAIGSAKAHARRAAMMWKFQTPLVLGPASAKIPRAHVSSAMRAHSQATTVASAGQVRLTGSNQAHALRAAMMWNFQTLAANVSIRRGNARSATRALSKATIVVCAAQVRATGSNQAHARPAAMMWQFQTPLVLGPANVSIP